MVNGSGTIAAAADSRQQRSAIAIVVIVAMVGLYAFSDIWRANRNRPSAPEQIEFVET